MNLESFSKEFEFIPKKSCELYCDNKAVVNSVHHEQTKHVEVIDAQFIKENLDATIIRLPFV